MVAAKDDSRFLVLLRALAGWRLPTLAVLHARSASRAAAWGHFLVQSNLKSICM